MEIDKIYNKDCLITERIKTLEDTCNELGDDDVFVAECCGKQFIDIWVGYLFA